MNSRMIVTGLVAAALGGVISVFGYIWLVGGSGEASAPISAPTLDINAVPTLSADQAFAAATQVAELSAQVASLEATLEAQPSVGSAAEASTAGAEPTAAADETGRILYRIDSADSLVTFRLQEDLRGVRTEVIGTTSEVAGDIILDYGNPSASQIGTIRINARTLETDNEFRNRALRSEILQSASDAYEFIEFVPTALTGLPESVVSGETYTFKVVGDLTIIGQTQPVTFTAQVMPASEAQLSGAATATVKYAGWGINIPNAPGVANITEDVTLTINFVANQVES